jgi:hypothetical protein
VEIVGARVAGIGSTSIKVPSEARA